MKVVIDRSRWLRGTGEAGSALLISTGAYAGKMCCLGFSAISCGYTQHQIIDRASPARVTGGNLWPTGTLNVMSDNSDVISDMMRVNDRRIGDNVALYSERGPNGGMNFVLLSTEEDREKKLTELAARLGWEFEFVDQVEEKKE